MAQDFEDFSLGISGFNFSDLYSPIRLKDLHAEFWKFAETNHRGLRSQFEALNPATKPPDEAQVLIDTAHQLDGFLAKLFVITTHTQKLKALTLQGQPTYRLKREFLNTRVFKRLSEPAISREAFLPTQQAVQKMLAHYPGSDPKDAELHFAELVGFLLDCEKGLKAGLDQVLVQKAQGVCSHIVGTNLEDKVTRCLKLLEDWSVQMWVDPKRRVEILAWNSWIRPQKLDFENLVPTLSHDPLLPESLAGHDEHLRHRDGFKLTDSRMAAKQYLREVDYCIYCHQREKDSCSKGFAEKSGGYKKNPLGIELSGCPLDERISEMHLLRKEGEAIGALAMIMLDNPMCPGTGHRICNDCMKGCIFQKQDPVNIPQTETGILTEVLNLPYGFEIYSLMTRFNPLNRNRPYALPYNGRNVLVVGLGPAGYTLSHYLANDGFGVIGVDALKLEPMDSILSGLGRAFPKPVQNFSDLTKDLDTRVLQGFGGVSEYGITVRWDKNFLAVIYLSLVRRQMTRFYGGVRFGGTLNLEDAWELGFDHVALATGAGRPTIIPMKNNLIRGIRKASDFLMALQLTGAFKKQALANLQIQLPAVVIGGGLTAIDTATEILAYYPIQVEKIYNRHEVLSAEYGEQTVLSMCSDEEKVILKTFLEHGKRVKEERQKALHEKRAPRLTPLCRQWGGVSIAYRKRMVDSPAYRLNHEEVAKALEEGIYFIENVTPVEAIKDPFGAISGLILKKNGGELVTIPAKSVCVAAGTSPNTIYEREFPGTFELDEHQQFFKKYAAFESNGKWGIRAPEGEERAFFLSYENDGRLVSFYGDNHPDYAGNVVKAMASAKHGAIEVSRLFKKDIESTEMASIAPFQNLIAQLDEALIPRVVRVDRLTPTIVEVIVRAKFAAQKFEPGQFFRLQNYETTAHSVEGVKLLMEGLALTGAWVDKEKDLLSMIVLEMGASSRLCSILKPGEPVVVMGPTGTPSEIPSGETVLLAGGGLGNAVLLSIAEACQKKKSRVIYFAGYRSRADLFKQSEIERVTDQVIWAVDSGEPISTNRPQDISFVGNIVKAMVAYASGKLGASPPFNFKDIDRIIAIGSDRMMAAVHAARSDVLKPYLDPKHLGIASINSPMQCMMKEVCAQCLQRHVDPKTGQESFVFSCFNQDQDMDVVDFENLKDRLKANTLSEKIANRFMDRLFAQSKVERS